MKLVLGPGEKVTPAGDMAIKDLTPQTTNVGDRLVKNMRICGSGLYKYHKSEISTMNAGPIPPEFAGDEWFNVYRPADVLVANKDKFARVPIITGHHQLVDRDNAKELMVGVVGDSVLSEVDEQDGETYLYTTGTIVAGDGVDAYEQFGELSVGYVPRCIWESGTHKGQPYQLRLTGFDDVNHLLICPKARGGHQCMVMDSMPSLMAIIENKNNGGQQMNVFTKIFGNKKVAGDSAVVSELIQSIAVGADPAVQVPKIKALVAGDETFNGYLDELVAAKGTADAKLMGDACEIVDKYYKENLAGDEKKPEDKKEEPMGDEKKPEDKKEEPIGDEKKPEDKKEEPIGDEKKPEEKPTGDESNTENKKPAGDAIDYEKLATMVAEKMAPKMETIAGDSEAIEGTVVLAGDSTGNKTKGSDDFMSEMFG